MPTFRHRARLDHPPDEVFRWHTRPGAFERLVPPWQDVRVVERTGGLETGSRIHLRVRKGPAGFDWVVEHTAVEEGRLFRDEQIRGPFESWHHTHRFVPDGEGCVLEDEIRWEPPLGKLADTFARTAVEGELRRLFAFRGRRLAGDLARHSSFDDDSLTVAVTGASGLVGTLLSNFLTAGGHRIRPLVRSREEAGGDAVYWNVEDGEIDASSLEGVDAVVHLAGESIFGLRWTEAKKERILESRRRGTRLLSEALAGLKRPPEVLVSASGVHFYGGRGEEILTESSGPGEGFLARVCREWERATEPASRSGIRVVLLRSGILLTPTGGALEKMLPPFKLGLGGRIGDGRQYMSWIDPDDHVGLIHHALRGDTVEGPLNAVAPHAVPNAAFTDALGRVLGRPTLLPLPSPAVKAALGQMGRELLLEGQRTRPEKALSTGFSYRFPDVESSLRHQLGRTGSGEDGGGDTDARVERRSP